MEILLIAMVLSGVVTKWVQDGRTDREYARKGMVSPRYQERLAKLEKAGAPVTRTAATERGPLRSYLSELYADAMVDLTERHRAKRAVREPYDPTAPTWRQRFSAGVLAEIADYKRKAGWRQPELEPATEPAVPEPVEYEPGTVTFDADGNKVPVTWIGSPTGHRNLVPEVPSPYADVDPEELFADHGGPQKKRPVLGDRYTDEWTGRVYEWIGDTWTPVCSEHDVPMNNRDGDGWLCCPACGVRSVDDRPRDRIDDGNLARTLAVYEDEGRNIAARRAEECPTCHDTGVAEEGFCPACGTDEDRRLAGIDHPSVTTGGPTMTGEAVNYETATVALAELTAATQALADHVAGAVSDAESFRTHVEEVDEAKRTVRDTLASVVDQLGAKGVDATTQARINDALELINANDLTAALEHIDGAKSALGAAQAGASEASTAAGSANDSLDETYADIDERMRAHGTDGSFVGATA